MNAIRSRTIHVFVRDVRDCPLSGAVIRFWINDQAAGEVPSSEGRASIQVENRTDTVQVEASYQSEKQKKLLAQSQDDWTFKFNVDTQPSFMQKHLALVFGLALLGVALALGFIFSSPNLTQIHLIIATASLAGGLIATEMPGMLKVNASLGKKLVIGATGTLAVFVLLYFFAPSP